MSSRIWLLDFARQYPNSAHLDGLDINLDQVPHLGWLPPNVSFRKYSVFEEPPADLKEKYDVIHARHLLPVIKQNDPSEVLDNILKMLSMLRAAPSEDCCLHLNYGVILGD